MANVASRTSSSHSAVRAPARVERSRCRVSQATSSSAFDRSNRRRPVLAVDHVDLAEQPHEQRPRRVLVGPTSVAARPGLAASRRARARRRLGVDQRRVRRGRARRGSSCELGRRQPDGDRAIPSGSSVQRPASARSDHGAPGASPATTIATPPRRPFGARRPTSGVTLPGDRRPGEHDGRLPRLPARVPRPQHERALPGRRGRRRPASPPARAPRRRSPTCMGLAVIEERVVVDADADEVGDLGEHRRRRAWRRCPGPRRRPVVGGGHGQQAEGLEVDEHLAAGRRRRRAGSGRRTGPRRRGPPRPAARRGRAGERPASRRRPPTAGAAWPRTVSVSSTAPSGPRGRRRSGPSPSTSDAAAARTATSTRSSRSPASTARSRRSVATASGAARAPGPAGASCAAGTGASTRPEPGRRPTGGLPRRSRSATASRRRRRADGRVGGAGSGATVVVVVVGGGRGAGGGRDRRRDRRRGSGGATTGRRRGRRPAGGGGGDVGTGRRPAAASAAGRQADAGEVDLLADVDQVGILDGRRGWRRTTTMQVGGDGGVVVGQAGPGETVLGQGPELVAGGHGDRTVPRRGDAGGRRPGGAARSGARRQEQRPADADQARAGEAAAVGLGPSPVELEDLPPPGGIAEVGAGQADQRVAGGHRHDVRRCERRGRRREARRRATVATRRRHRGDRGRRPRRRRGRHWPARRGRSTSTAATSRWASSPALPAPAAARTHAHRRRRVAGATPAARRAGAAPRRPRRPRTRAHTIQREHGQHADHQRHLVAELDAGPARPRVADERSSSERDADEEGERARRRRRRPRATGRSRRRSRRDTP